MSAIFNNTTAKVLTATLTGTVPNAAGRVLICAWHKWDATALNSANTVFALANTNSAGNPGFEVFYNTTPVLVAAINGVTANGATTMSSGTWYNTALGYGPWNGSSQTRQLWTSGTLASTGVSATSSVLDMTFLAIGRRLTAASAAKGRIAQVGIWIGLTTVQEAAVVLACQSYHVDTISPAPNFSWRLSTAVTAATGGIALTNTGTVTFDGADDPTLTDYSAGGSAWISSCVV